MKFDPPLKSAELIRRYKRFLADVRLPDDSRRTIHCPNTGSMRGCAEPGSRIWYSTSANKARKYPDTFELIEVDGGAVAGINTARANALVHEALEQGRIAELAGYDKVRREVRYGETNSRIDFLLADGAGGQCYVEVKSVTLALSGGLGLFPDAVSTRGTRHLRELMTVKRAGHRAVLLFCVQHTGIERVAPADDIDSEYAAALREAAAAGVEVLAYRAAITPRAIAIERAVPVVLEPRS